MLSVYFDCLFYFLASYMSKVTGRIANSVDFNLTEPYLRSCLILVRTICPGLKGDHGI